MAVDLSALPIVGVEPALMEFGGVLMPALGGPIQRIDRLGTRWAFRFETPPMFWEPDGRAWAAKLARAKREGGVIEIPQPLVPIGNPGAPVVATNIASGRLVALSGLTAGYAIRQGQWLSIIKNGQRYADQVVEAVTASGGGAATVTIQNLLRVPLAGGETVELAAPKVEGSIDGDFSWPIGLNRMVSFNFTLREDA